MGPGRCLFGDVAVQPGAGPPRRPSSGVRSGGQPDPSGCLPDEVDDRPVVVDPTVIEQHDPLTQRGQVLGLVGRQHDHGLAGDLGQHSAQGRALLGVQARRRLVQHQDLGGAEQCLRQAEASPLSAGEGADPFSGAVGQTDRVEHSGDLLVAGARPGPFLEHGDVVDELEGGEPTGKAEFLRQVAELAADAGLLGRHRRVVSKQGYRAGGGRQRRGQDAQQGCLAGAVGAEQAGHAAAEGQARVAHRPGAAVAASDGVDLDGGGHSPLLPVRSSRKCRSRSAKTPIDTAATAR